MTTTTELKLCKGLPYQIRVRARGEFDEVLDNQVFNADSSVSVNMTTYDGFDMDYNENYECAQTVDFSNTLLPWKFEYSDTLQDAKFCLMPRTDTAYENITATQGATPETLHGCLSQFINDDGSAFNAEAWVINGNEYMLLVPEGFKNMQPIVIQLLLGNAKYLADVSIPAHTKYYYDNGTWSDTPPAPPSYVRQFTVTGSPTIDDEACTVSGFSSNDYITADTSFSPAQGDNWILRCSFIAPAPNGSMQTIAESHGFLFALDEDNFLYFSDSDGTNGDSIFMSDQIQEGDVIDFSVNYNNGGYDWEFYNDTQGTSYTGSQVATLTDPVNSSTPVFGVRYGSHTNAFNGTLKMLQCQMIVSNGGVTSLDWIGYVYE